MVEERFCYLDPARVAVPFRLPPPYIDKVNSDRIIKRITYVVPVYHLDLRLLVFGRKLPLGRLPQGTRVARLTMFHSIRIGEVGSVLLFRFPVTFVVATRKEGAFLARFVPRGGVEGDVLTLDVEWRNATPVLPMRAVAQAYRAHVVDD